MKLTSIFSLIAITILILFFSNNKIFSQLEARHAVAESSLHVPPDITVSCEVDYKDLNNSGRAYLDFYPQGNSLTFTDKEKITECGTGRVIRKFTVMENGGQLFSKEQIITLSSTKSTSVKFPKNICSSCVECLDDLHPDNLPEEYSYPSIETGCDQIEFTFSDEVFYLGNGSVRVKRTWDGQNVCNPSYPLQHLQILEANIQTFSDPIAKQEDAVKEAFQLHQNRPNPYSESGTLISYVLPKAGETMLTVQDVNGRILYQQKNYASEGYNEIKLDFHGEWPSGILWYTLQSAENKATKKMVSGLR